MRPIEAKILHLYLKKLTWQGRAWETISKVLEPPEIHLDFDHGSSPLPGYDDCHEVWLRLRVTATLAGSPLFAADILQAGIFRLTPARSGRLKDLFAWCSGVLYGQALRTLSTTMRNGGFEPLQYHDQRFSHAFRVDVGGPAITLGRLSDLGEIMSGFADLRQEPPASVPRIEQPLFWVVICAMLVTCAAFYLFVLPSSVLDRMGDLIFAPAARQGMLQVTPEPGVSKVFLPHAAPLFETGEKTVEQVAEPVPGGSLATESGLVSGSATSILNAPVQDHVPARYAAAVASGARWATDQPAGYFTLQLAALGQLEDIPQIIRHSRFHEPVRLVRAAVVEGGAFHYLVLLGSYSSESAASAAARKLRESDPALVPKIKSFVDISFTSRDRGAGL